MRIYHTNLTKVYSIDHVTMAPHVMHIRFGSLLHLCLLLLLPHLSASLNALDCTNSKKEWLTLRYTSTALLAGGNPFPQNLEVCPIQNQPSTETSGIITPHSCCDRMMEHEMLMLGNSHLSQQARLRWFQVANQMRNHSADLQDFFRSDLQQSKDRLNQFFSRIYGYNYKMHRNFFFAFFDDLEGYMAGQKATLGPLVDNFFNRLRDSIVSLIERSNQPPLGDSAGPVLAPSQSGGVLGAPGGSGGGGGVATDEVTESDRIRCLSERVAQQQPFGGVDVLVRTRLLEAYPPARMLVNVLVVTSHLLLDVMHHVTNSPECSLAVTRSQFCSMCAGRPHTDICPDTCKRLVSECLRVDGGNTAQLSVIWPRLIDSIVSIMTRLERAFNFPAVNRYLQMQISEAITNLQSRYAESKAKYHSECRLPSSGGRGLPNLFASGFPSADSRQQQQQLSSSFSSGSSSSASSWPSASSPSVAQSKWPSSPDQYHYRPRRSAQDWRYQQASPLSPPFASQPVVQPGYAHMARNGVGPPGYLLSADGQQQAPAGFGGHGLAEGNSVASGATDSQEGLIRWAAQLKHRYTSLGNLFADADGGLCPPALRGQQHPNDTSKSQCWSPTVAAAPENRALAAVVQQLTEAAEHLQTAAGSSSSSTSDPEPLRTTMPASGGPFGLGLPSGGSQHAPGPFDWSPDQAQASPLRGQHQLQQQQFSGNQYQQQWQPNQPALPYGAAAAGTNFDSAPMPTYGEVNTPFMGGSGMEPSTVFGGGGLGYPPVNRQPQLQPDAYGGQDEAGYQQPPAGGNPAFSPYMGLGSGQLPPQDTYYSQAPPGSSPPQWPPPHIDEWGRGSSPQWGMQPSPAQPDVREWPPSTAMSPESTPGNINNSLANQTVAQSVVRPDTRVENTSYVPNATVVPVTTTTPAPRESNVVKNITAPPTQPSTQKHLITPSPVREQHVDEASIPRSNLPDDEDSLIIPEDVHKAIPETPMPAENKPPPSSWAAENTPAWNEPPPSSGFPPSAPTPYLPAYGWDSQFGVSQPNQVLTPPQHSTGMEMPGAFQPELTPPDANPSPMYPPHPWGTPDVGNTHPDQTLQGGWMPQPSESSGQSLNRLYTPDEPTQDTYPQWPHTFPNSGKFDTDRTGPTHFPGEDTRGRPVESHQTTEPAPPPAPQLPPYVKPQTALPHPPMPPPEVWVPAKIAPGQSGPSILLVREYNVQGPYYGSEIAPKATGAPVYKFSIVSIFVTQLISTIVFYPSI